MNYKTIDEIKKNYNIFLSVKVISECSLIKSFEDKFNRSSIVHITWISNPALLQMSGKQVGNGKNLLFCRNFNYLELTKIFSLLLFIFFFLLPSAATFAQVDSTGILNDKIFQYLEDATQDKDDSQLYEIFDELLSNPVDINRATVSDLTALPFVSKLNAKRIIKFIKRKKGISSLDELQKIKNLDENILVLLKPFVKIIPFKSDRKQPGQKAYLKLRSRLMENIQTQKGFLTNKYSGNKLKVYQRIKANYNNFGIGFLTEKDAGEKSLTDFASGFLRYKSNGIIKKIIAGDFNFEFGQGLAIWSPYAFSKGTDATNSVIKNARNLIAYSSSDENNFLRGAASTVQFGFFNFSAFYSQKHFDATLFTPEEISNLYLSGYHRTESELKKKNNVSAITYGASVKFNLSDNFDISFLHYKTNFSIPFYKRNIFSLNGNNFAFTSAAYNFYMNNLLLSGEFSYNGTSVASINNFYFNVNNNLTLTTSIRNYPKNYSNIFSNGFGEKSNTQNELGFYIGVKLKTGFGLLNAYYDLFKHPLSKNNLQLPTVGNDFLLNYYLKLKSNLAFNFKFKTETKNKEFPSSKYYEIADESKTNYRAELSYKLSKNIYGKNRVEFVKYDFNKTTETGILVFQDVKIILQRFNLVSRIIFFETDSYNSRIYEFENNIRGVLTNLPMYGNGFKWYVILNFHPFEQLRISARYSETYKPNVKSFGSGLSEVKGNVNNRFSLQLDIEL